jgi:fluoride exporter
MNGYFLVMAGGAVGAGARYALARALEGVSASWPWPTFLANVVGGLLMGLLAAHVLRGGAGVENVRLFVGVGLLGGFTTFSAFSLEMAQMVERGQAGLAVGYAMASVILALAAVFAGLALSKAALA